ncbi:hypothetical protein CQW49_22455 (plasmid) [Methylosinus trichosporium OB3b]|uniref:Uncharacterized protein n=2 Tax=Methylosinus trichosporium TaxID=426 RepID=A0A2D2D6V8_METT3|nr:hypothetical protein CQW49_22455 [Methylosinus trichosporium OB3b]
MIMLDQTNRPSGAQAFETATITEPLEGAIREVEQAAHGWGVRTNHPEGRFIAVFMAALRALGSLVAGSVAEMREIVRGAQSATDAEIARLREANRMAALAIRQAEVVQETIVSNVCKDLVKNLTSESQQWLVLAENNIHRRRTRIFAMKMSAAAVALLSVSFWSGYQIRVLQDEPALQSLARCAKTPMRVAIQGQPTGDWVCKLETLAPREWRDLPDELKHRWLTWWPFSG